MKLKHNIARTLFKRSFNTIALTTLLSSSVQAADYLEDGFILASIKPLQLITADITQGIIETRYLLPAGASPHAYSLRPSEVKSIQAAKHIYWVGPTLETFLQKPFKQHPEKETALLPELQALALVSAPKPGHDHDEHKDHDEHEHHNDHEGHDHGEHKGHDEHEHHDDHEGHDHDEHKGHDEHEHHDDHDEHKGHDEHDHEGHGHVHDHNGIDPHVWLDPKNALAIANIVKEQLIELYPQHSALLEKNYLAFVQDIEQADQQIAKELEPLEELGFIVFHDGYSHFIKHYGLNQVAALTINPSKKPGAKHLAEIRQLLSEKNPVCIFSEPQFNKVAVTSVVRGSSINLGELDPLAVDIDQDNNRYTFFLTNFAQQFTQCLAK